MTLLFPATRRTWLHATTALALATLLGACGQREAATTAAAPAPASAASAPERELVVGTDAVYAPFEYQDEKGQIVGFDIDVLRATAEAAGLRVRFVNTPWEGMFNTLLQGDRDVLVSAITITDERRQTMAFSAPYFDAVQLIAVPSASKVAHFADLKTLRVGVQTGTTGDEAASQLMGKTNARLRRFESTPLALKELESGGLDAVVADNGVIAHYVANNGGTRFRAVSDPAFVPEQYGFALRPADSALRERLDAGLRAIRADGRYDAIHTRWFGPK
ncbi:basic amino acid ABC transporter substrate-binding protein [Ideonella sp. 4Y16]|uniref:basic amino acid ABC transporter substrate-binding protein n=1 Tax=Ideonella alba TaxID=2824118 RepID=UPI001B38D132|nr:basic amino acid ABC transporter substrate-binding protein [Ideonella alba]MBQ0943303.1 basic amino acid ABC transporter substrate-binding protein [Ideonella alba]